MIDDLKPSSALVLSPIDMIKRHGNSNDSRQPWLSSAVAETLCLELCLPVRPFVNLVISFESVNRGHCRLICSTRLKVMVQ